MYATAELGMKYEWPPGFAEHLRYDHELLDWCAPAGMMFDAWRRSGISVEVVRVQQLMTRNPNFHDYDLAAVVRAVTSEVRARSGYPTDLIIDAAIGMHLTNRGEIYPRMWYGREVAVLTRSGSPRDSRSWVISPDRWQYNCMRQLILTRLSGVGNWWDRRLVYQGAFARLCAQAHL